MITDQTQLNELVHVHVFKRSLQPQNIGQILEAITTSVPNDWFLGQSLEFFWNGTFVIIDTSPFERGTYEFDTLLYKLWQSRKGKPYQADLEAHVAKSRRHLSWYIDEGDWVVRGIVALNERGFDVKFPAAIPNSVVVTHNGIGTDYAYCSENGLFVAFWNAAIQACSYTSSNEEEPDGHHC